MNSNLGYVVWGVKNGFQNNLFSHNLIDSVKNSLVDVQSLCMPLYSEFYSINRVGGFTLVSLYNPDTRDFKGRKAYIVFTIIFPSGIYPTGNIFELFNKFKKNYMQDSSGIVNPELFYKYLMELSISTGIGSNSSINSKIGYKIYSSIEEIKDVFNTLDILDYQKVYFFDKPEISVNSFPNIEQVQSLEKKYSVDLINYNPHDFQITINGSPVTNENLHTQGPYAKLINLKKTDKIEIKRGGSQPVASFNANEKTRVDLPKPQPANPKEITFRNLDPSKHEVRINGVPINTTKTENGVFIFPISTQNVKVEIIDRNSKQVIQTNDTAISKDYEVRVLTTTSGGIVGTVGTTQTGQSGTGGNGGSTTSGHTIGITNSGGGAIIGNDKPKKKSKAGLIITLSSIVILAIVAIVLWKSGIFDEEVNPPVAGTTQNASPNAGTENVVPVAAEMNEYPGYTLKSKYPTFKTEEGFKESNDDIYRLKDGKLEVKYYQKETKNYGAWTEMKNPLLASVLKSYFDKNDEGSDPEDTEKTTNGDTKTGGTKTGGTSTGGTNSGGSNSGGGNKGSINFVCIFLKSLYDKAESLHQNTPIAEVETKKQDLIRQLKTKTEAECTGCEPSWSKVKEKILGIKGY